MTVALQVDMDVQQLLLRMRKGEKKLAYGTVIAITRTAERVQQAEIEHQRRAFIVRRPEFLHGSPGRPGGAGARLKKARIEEQHPFAEVFVDPMVGAGSKGGPLLLSIFEEGGVRPKRTAGARSVAEPLTGRPARPSIRSQVPPAFTFAGLHFRAYQGKRRLLRRRRGRTVPETVFGEFGRTRFSMLSGFNPSRGVDWKGEQRAFILSHTAKEPLGGVFQRFGRGPEGIREIYTFREPPVLEPRLRFVETAERVAPQFFAEEMRRAVLDALEHEGLPTSLLRTR
jgi:hypothetical protein